MRAGLASLVIALVLTGCLPDPPATTNRERCLDCHADTKGFSEFHPIRTMGCASCHLGDTSAEKKAEAHEDMILIPGNLADANFTCGAAGCHPEWTASVQTSLMATARGIVSVDRWVFGEQETPNGLHGMADLGDSPADTHLKQLCITCHLGSPKTELGPLDTRSRGGGCLTCHLDYDDVENENDHARLTSDVDDDRCFGCHSRSGRVSLNYRGWHETVLSLDEMDPADSTLTILADRRVVEKQTPDVHQTVGLRCTDCHSAREMMGDGQVWEHQEQSTEVTCESCHAPASPIGYAWEELDQRDQRIITLRRGTPPAGRTFARAERTGRAMTNLVRDPGGPWQLLRKSDAAIFTPGAPTAACEAPGHQRLTCQSCHSAWVPQCIGCHTQRLPDGAWQEMISDFRADPPVLGVREFRNPEGQIEPFAPGMIMTLNQRPLTAHADTASSHGSGSFHRLYSPRVPHTTATDGRTCESCHLDPLALGFGRGTLDLAPDGTWSFEPEYADLRDGLPADAWIPFLGEGSTPNTTRSDARPFRPEEQLKILRVGACLTCHPAAGSAAGTIFEDFGASLEQATAACIVPSA